MVPPVTPERDSSWSDDRLNDLAAQVRLLASMPVQMASMTTRLEMLAEDNSELRAEIAHLTKILADREQQDLDRRRAELEQRKKDRTALYGAASAIFVALITTIGLIITNTGGV